MRLFNWLLDTDVIRNSPVIMGVILLVLILGNMSDAGRMISVAKQLIKQAVIAFVLVYGTTYVLSNWFITATFIVEVPTIINWLSIGLNIYFAYLMFRFIAMTGRTLSKWYLLFPVIVLLGSRLLTSIVG